MAHFRSRSSAVAARMTRRGGVALPCAWASASGEGRHAVAATAMALPAAQAMNTAVGPPMPPSAAATSGPINPLTLSQYDTRRLPPTSSSVDRAMVGSSTAPVGRSVLIAPSPSTTSAATAGEGRSSAAAMAAPARATACTAKPARRTLWARWRAVRCAASGAKTRVGTCTARATKPTAEEPPQRYACTRMPTIAAHSPTTVSRCASTNRCIRALFIDTRFTDVSYGRARRRGLRAGA